MQRTQPKPKKMLDESNSIYHGVCRDCPDEWVDNSTRTHFQAMQHALCRDHRTVVQVIDE
jgi:hypothetical protein